MLASSPRPASERGWAPTTCSSRFRVHARRSSRSLNATHFPMCLRALPGRLQRSYRAYPLAHSFQRRGSRIVAYLRAI